MSVLRTVYQLGYQISPIILQNGIAGEGKILPIVALTEPASIINQILGGEFRVSLDGMFAHFEPMPGGSLVKYQVGMYPFANQATAANAIMSEPIPIGIKMTCPVKDDGGYLARAATFAVLRQVIQKHCTLGGLFTVLTPAATYTSCILTDISDMTGGDTRQTQVVWAWRFIRPLIAQSEADRAVNALISKLGLGLKP